MLRIHFTPEDLTRVRVAPGPDVLWEITNSVQTLQRTDGERVFGAWRRRVRPRLPESRRLLTPLLPPHGYSPDFLTPACGDRSTLRSAVDTLLGTPRRRLRTELARLARAARLPSWVSSLADGRHRYARAAGRSAPRLPGGGPRTALAARPRGSGGRPGAADPAPDGRRHRGAADRSRA
ncbi:hypothetical protein SCALM49S_09193 [Streptomyces californicus]